jgi:hypothetical protein
MTERYCPKCDAEVQDLGGYCALGHSLMLRSITDISDLGDLKAEVDRAFAEAELQVASAIASVKGAVTGEFPAVRPSEAPRSPQIAQTPPQPAAPAASPDAPPPPPPGPHYADEFDEFDEEARSRRDEFWKALENDPEPSRTDPITAFAPAPRMDWGPNKAAGKKPRRK